MYVLRVLGTLSLERDGMPVEAISAHRNAQALLTILATDGPTSRDRLMLLLWPESDTERARGSLRQAIHAVRHRLGAPELVEGQARLGLADRFISSDVQQFRAALDAGDLAAAVSLYGGPFLDGMHLGGSAELDEWVEDRRGELASKFAKALDFLAEEAAGRGDLAQAIEWRRRRVHMDPLDGRATLDLMRALAAAGDHRAAIELGREYARLLQREGDLPPEPEVQRLTLELEKSLRAAPAPSHAESVASAASASIASGAGPAPVDGDAHGSAAPRTRWKVNRSHLLTGGTLAALLMALAANGRRTVDHDAPLATNLVAIAPFDATDASLTLWREGLGDILAKDLDGAGPIQTVPLSVVLQRWNGPSEREAAERLGIATGAGVVIYGHVLRHGPDSIGIRATVLDLAASTIERDLEVRGAEARLGEMADSLGVRILRILGRSRNIAATRHVSIGARSLPALKEFLLGEQFYRRAEWDSALAHYDRAIAQDSTFALAHWRMTWVLGGVPNTASRYSLPYVYMRRAIANNRGLAPRDSLLLLAHTYGGFLGEVGNPDSLLMRPQLKRDLIEALSKAYPDDPQIWEHLGDLHLHTAYPARGSNAEALAELDRAIALDSGFAPAYMHTLHLAFILGDDTLARRYAIAFENQDVPAEFGRDFRLAARLLEGNATGDAARRRWLDSADIASLDMVANHHFVWRRDSAEIAISINRLIVARGHEGRGHRVLEDTVLQQQELASALAFRGHLKEAVKVNSIGNRDANATRYGYTFDPFWDLARFGLLDRELVLKSISPAWQLGWDEDPGLNTPPRHLRGLPWLAEQGDTATIKRLVSRAEEMDRPGRSPVSRVRGRYFGGVAAAYLTLLRGDTAGAIAGFRGISDSLCMVGVCVEEKLTLARLLASRGNDSAAAAELDLIDRQGRPRVLHIIIALERGRLAERLRDSARARREYRFVTEAWRDPDPELLEVVAEARSGLARLAGVAE